MLTKKCLKCNKEFSFNLHQRPSTAKFCSSECYNKWKKGNIKFSEKRNKQLSDTWKRLHAEKKYPNVGFQNGHKAWSEGLTKETDERIRKISEKQIGKVPWNVGLTKEDIRVQKYYRAKRPEQSKWMKEHYDVIHTPEAHIKASKKLTGRKHPWQDKITQNPERNRKISEKLIGREINWADKVSETRKRLFREGKLISPTKGKHIWEGKRHPNLDKCMSEDQKLKLRNKAKTPERIEIAIKNLGAYEGKNNSNWLDGISFEPYSSEFTKRLKEMIRARDNFTCQLCGLIQNGHKHAVHHIDYNKKNTNPNNLITLCHDCHSKTNINREQWVNYFNGNFI